MGHCQLYFELADGTFVLQLKPGYTPLIRKFAQRPLIPASSLKTLSYIAYEQPVTFLNICLPTRQLRSLPWVSSSTSPLQMACRPPPEASSKRS